MTATVRIVIPAYNRGFCIGEALRSVLDQTFSNFEVIVADDGSIDHTAQVIHDYAVKDSRIRLLTLEHGGTARARNSAIQLAGDHEYVAFLDSDDLWFPTHLEQALLVLNSHAGVGLYFSGVELPESEIPTSENSKERRFSSGPADLADASLGFGLHLLDSETCRKAFIWNSFVPQTPTVVVRRKAVGRVPWFIPHLIAMEDSEFFLSLVAAGHSFVFNDQITVRVRRFAEHPLRLVDRPSVGLKEWLDSVLHFHREKLKQCNLRSERRFVSAEIAGYASQLGQNSYG